MKKKVGIIGGSGLYDIDGLENIKDVKVDTPFGAPSGTFKTGTLDGLEMVFLPRHGHGHSISPSEINFRANIYAMKKLGVTHIVSISAVGSMKEEYAPGHFVVIDQYIDRTKGIRPSTFFEGGLVGHVSFADPVCKDLSEDVLKATEGIGKKVHFGGTYVCMEGPQFSTRAESNLYRSWGVDIIGMTAIPESKLAREAEICYSTLALVTDYDCWKEEEEAVSVDAVLATLKSNSEAAKKFVKALPKALREEDTCKCSEALKFALMTNKDLVSDKLKKDLNPIIGKYL